MKKTQMTFFICLFPGVVRLSFIRYPFIVLLAAVLWVAANTYSFAPTADAAGYSQTGRLLDIREAIDRAQKLDEDMVQARADVKIKQVEWTQALHAVIGQSLKDQSLFAKPHSLSKDIDIGMKIPTAAKQLKNAQMALENKQRSVAYDTKMLYLNAVQAGINADAAQEKRDAADAARKETETKVKFRLADPEQLKAAEDALQNAESQLKLAGLAYKNAKIALGKKVGMNLDEGYRFSVEPQYTVLTQDAMWAFYQHAAQSDYAWFQVREDRKLAETKASLTKRLYSAKFSSRALKIIESMYQEKPVNYDLFLAQYDQFLDQVKKDWEGFIYIIFPFPKVIFQGEFDGSRYFDDIKYSLPVSMMELDKAKLKEQDAQAALDAKVKKSYLDAKTAEENYAKALQDLDAKKKDLQTKQTRFGYRLLSRDALDQAAQDTATAEAAVKSAMFSYLSALYTLDNDTSGGVEPYLTVGVLPYQRIDDGLEPFQSAAADQAAVGGKWELADKAGSLIAELHVTADKQIPAPYYGLYLKDGTPLSDIVPVKQPLSALKLVFNDLSELSVLFYDEPSGQPTAEAGLDGYGSAGSLAVQATPQTQPKPGTDASQGGTLLIGTYMIALSALNDDNYAAAQATVASSGQGAYYRSELADDAWFSLDNAVSVEDIQDPQGSLAVPDADIAKLKVAVAIGQDGLITSPLSKEELAAGLEQSKQEAQQLEEQSKAAAEAGEAQQSADLALQAKSAEAQAGLLAAILAGDQAAAQAQMVLASSPDAVVKQAEQEAAAEEQKQLAAKQDQLQAQFQQLLDAGDLEAAAQMAQAKIDASLQLAEAESGVADEIDALNGGIAAVQEALGKTEEQGGSAEDAEALQSMLAPMQQNLLQLQKKQDFLKLDATQAVAEELKQAGADTSALDGQIVLLAEQIQSMVKAEYTEDELAALAEVSQRIEEASGGAVQALPVETLISGDFDFKLDLPPVTVDGNAFLQIRPISEALGATVTWDASDGSVTVSYGLTTMALQIGNPTAYVNGNPIALEQSPRLVQDRAVVPMRAVFENLGLRVRWDELTNTIQIHAGF